MLLYLVIGQRSIQSKPQSQSIQTPNIWRTVGMTHSRQKLVSSCNKNICIINQELKSHAVSRIGAAGGSYCICESNEWQESWTYDVISKVNRCIFSWKRIRPSFSLIRLEMSQPYAFCEMMSWPPSWECDITSEIQIHQSVHIYFTNNPAKFHPSPIWNNWAINFLRKEKEEEQQQQQWQDE